jgi:GMP synthase-like glutamine amidotransferase
MKKVAVIQHVDWEGPGQFLIKAAEHCQVELRVFEAWKNSLPDPDQFAGIVILGGGPNVDEVEKYPFLKVEKEWLQEVIRRDKPCLGICLGHQLLAEALGATIGRNFCNSVGIVKGLITSNGKGHPLFSGCEMSMPLFKWHGQSVQTPVPHHFDILVTSKECQVESFSIKGRPHLVGVQFDNHAGHINDVKSWCRKDQAWLSSIGFAPESILDVTERQQQSLADDFIKLFSSFCIMLES